MSTRATITIQDRYDAFHIYRHSDGYPEAVLPDIELATQYAWKFPRFEAWDFAAAIVKVMKNKGGNIYFTKEAKNHSNRNYHYQVTKEGNNLKIETIKI